MNNQPVILIDWGSTNLRAWHCTHEGEILDTLASEKGVTRIDRSEITGILSSLVNNWFGPANSHPVRIIMAGMIGSERGLGGAPYISCPAWINTITPKKHIISDERMNVWIIPGMSVCSQDNHNVMRGEETQLIGAWSLSRSDTYIMPGTHSKWVRIDNGLIETFHTSMTGELYYLLMKESLIGRGLPAQETSHEIFQDGVRAGLKQERLLCSIFEVRGAYVLDELDKKYVGEYLSGLLIGAEVRQMAQLYSAGHSKKIVVIAEENLSRRYETAFAMAEVASERIDGKKAFLLGMRGFIDELTE